jgi:putative stress-induced transcription regulator/CGNR zinc finger protein
VDVASYADLAVRLVNGAEPGQSRGDALATVECLRATVADRPQLAGRVSVSDLEALRLLRDELRLLFAAASGGQEAEVIERLNALLTRHPIHTEFARHDGEPWHLHLVDSGSVADKYAAGAIAGLTGVVAQSGTGRLGVCADSRCERVFVSGHGQHRRYCSDRCAPKADVRALRVRGRSRPDPASTAAS